MSKFTKVYSKWHAQNNRKYDSAIKYHKALMKNFKDWQPPKKLVEVPQFVADWFENAKGDLEFRIWQYIRDWREIEQNDFWFWFSEDRNNPTETLIRMKIEGYTVKKEQLYVLEFPNRTNPYVYYVKSNMITQQCSQIEDAKRFTEAEIKAIDERYWAFAVKVDEVKP